MLQPDVEKRFTINQIMHHPYVMTTVDRLRLGKP
jgi:hypothetical protein